MTPEVDVSSELAETRRRLAELEPLVENSPIAIPHGAPSETALKRMFSPPGSQAR